MKNRPAVLLAIFLFSACSAVSNAPAGWRQVPGASTQWQRERGAQLQTYGYARSRFAGTLPDLASQVVEDALLRNPGSRLHGANVPFAPCPGQAGIASFTLPGGKLRQEGFAVRDGQSIRTVYERPAAAAADPAVTAAMQSVLC